MSTSRHCMVGVLALLLCGCAVTDHFDDRATRYDLAVAQSRDAMILTNVIRASHAEPLSFVQLGKVSGTASASATVGLPSLIFGPHVASAASAVTHVVQGETIFGANPSAGSGYTGNSTSMTGSTIFEVTPTETKDFYRALLTEVEPRTLQFFIEQGVARELLFYLFTDKLIEERQGRISELRNDPLDRQNFAKFQIYVQLAMDYGLSSEPIPGQSGVSRRDPSGLEDRRGKQERWRLCFNPRYRTPGIPPAGNTPICGQPSSALGERSVSFLSRDGELVKLTILPRSAFGIFQFLGRIVAAGERGRIRLYSAEAIDQPPLRDEFLFVVDNRTAGDCFIAIQYEGESYCVPKEGATNTKRILGLLTQLIALSTTIGDIPITQTVRSIQ